MPEDAVISFYKQGDFTDLCASTHLMSTKTVKAIKLTSVAGALERLRKEQNAFKFTVLLTPRHRTGRISDNDGGSKEA